MASSAMSESGGGGSGGGVISPSGPVSLGAVRGLFDGSGNLDLSGGAIFRGGSVGIGTTNLLEKLTILNGNVSLHSPNSYASGPEIFARWADVNNNKMIGMKHIYYSGSNQQATTTHSRIDFRSNNGIGLNFSDLSTNTVNVMSLLSNGNVGVRTTTPSGRLECFARQSSDDFSRFVVDIPTSSAVPVGQTLRVASNSLVFRAETFRIAIHREDNSNLNRASFEIGGSERLVIRRNGNVGIGTTSPIRGLHVVQPNSSQTSGGILISDSAQFDISGVNVHIHPGKYTNWDWTEINSYSENGNNFLVLSPKYNSGQPVTNIPRGNVGIGTTNPTRRMVINRLASENSRTEFALLNRDTSNGAGLMLSTTGLGNDPRTEVYVNSTGLDESWLGTPAITILSNGNVGIGANPAANRLYVNGNLFVNGTITPSSDDRVKFDESRIDLALPTILKLKPQTYRKTSTLEDTSGGFIESGLIAQEVYYDAPELRHLVHVPPDASGIEVPPAGYGESDDPNEDPDYSNWGSTPAALNYTGLIPYLIRGMQEQEARLLEHEAKLAAQQEEIERLRAAVDGGSV